MERSPENFQCRLIWKAFDTGVALLEARMELEQLIS
jgi:hypothetical protein